ncbi:MAG: hypothetical protein IPM34_05090 [Saprospiraceae bacterium]|nr:hypothetical protein [Saprospiraceae bacterium]
MRHKYIAKWIFRRDYPKACRLLKAGFREQEFLNTGRPVCAGRRSMNSADRASLEFTTRLVRIANTWQHE